MTNSLKRITNNRINTDILPLLIAIIAILIAIFLSFYKLGDVPPALKSDEAIFGIGALQILRDGPTIYVEGQGGAGVLVSYIVAFFFIILEPGKFALRFQASLFSVLPVVEIFLVVRLLFSDLEIRKVNWLASLTMLFFAVNFNRVFVSRMAFSIVQMAFIQLLAILFFLRAYKKQGYNNFVLGGLFLGILLYSYIAGWITPIIFVAFIISNFFVRYFQGNRRIFKIHKGWLTYVGIFLICIIPLVLFSIDNQVTGNIGRMGETSFLNPNINGGNPLGALWKGVYLNYTAFGLAPIEWILKKQWIMFVEQPLIVPAFGGLIMALWRFQQSSFRFLLLWWGWTIFPAILAPENVAHISRTIGAYAPFSILAALFWVELFSFVSDRKYFQDAKFKRVFSIIFVIGVTIGFLATYGQILVKKYDDYFNYWYQTKATQVAYHNYAIELAKDMEKLASDDSVFILPIDTAAGAVTPNATVNFFYELSNSLSPYYWIIDDERTLADELTVATRGMSKVYVIRWKISRYTGADPKDAIRYYLEKHGQLTEIQKFQYYDIETFLLDELNPVFSEHNRLNKVDVNFGNQISLVGYLLEDGTVVEVEAGDRLPVYLRWNLPLKTAEDLKVSLIIEDKFGNRLLFEDKYLENNIFHKRSSEWGENTTTDMYFSLVIPKTTFPDTYNVSILVYGDNGATLSIVGASNLKWSLGSIHIQASEEIGQKSEITSDWKKKGQVKNEIELYVNSELLPEILQPGQVLNFQILWNILSSPMHNYEINLDILKNGEVITSTPRETIGEDVYPTTMWREGENLLSWISINVPRGVGDTEIKIQANIWDSNMLVEVIPLVLRNVDDWEHRYDEPINIYPINANFANLIDLVGYQLETYSENLPLQTIDLHLYWRGQKQLDTQYITFVHLLNKSGEIITQVDHVPGNGLYPTTGWVTNEIITDDFSITMPAEISENTFVFEIGIYDRNTGQRISNTTNANVDDKLILIVPKP